MTDLSQVIRWQAGLVRGLAQSVLERAKAIRSSLPQPFQAADLPPTPVATASKKPRPKTAGGKKVARKPTPKRKAQAKGKKLK